MKKFILLLTFSLFTSILVSCHDDDAEIPWESRENTVTFEILADNNNATLEAYISHFQRLDTIKSGQKYTYTTKKSRASCRVSCNNYMINLTVRGYVNGKLKKEEKGRYIVDFLLDVK